ncbi:uncharacterized protein LOC117339034 [Pecten maximus]|uniref:uncharacterized protein LOC117339034 n=1 Tax=Pecten maximus TaxID=6579 RepID=UPI0014585CB0|nr:uncharacterized protein LOC117339034 [Pecten maximus]
MSCRTLRYQPSATTGGLLQPYRTPLNTGTTEGDQLVAAKMKDLASKGNALQQRVREENLDTRKHSWKSIDVADAVDQFPSMSEEDIRNLTIGVYQVKLARSYTSEHLSEDGDYTIMVNDGVNGMLRARIQSRHTSDQEISSLDRLQPRCCFRLVLSMQDWSSSCRHMRTSSSSFFNSSYRDT